MVAPSQPIIGKTSKDKDVMGALRAPKYNKQNQNTEFTSVNIMKKSLINGGIPEKEADQFINNLAVAIKLQKSKVIQIYKTVFLINLVDAKGSPLPKGTVDIFPFTVEQDNVAQRFKVLPNTLKEMGYNKFKTKTDDKDDLSIFSRAGLNYKVGQEMVFDGESMIPIYVIEVSF